MPRRRLRVLLTAAALSGVVLVFGGARAAVGSPVGSEQEGGIFRIVLNAPSGIDYIDPALASAHRAGRCSTRRAHVWSRIPTSGRLRDSACNRGRGGLPGGVGRRHDVHVQAAHRLSVQRRVAGPSKRLRARDPPCPRASDELAGRPLRARHRRSGPRARRRRRPPPGSGTREQARHPAHAARTDFPHRMASTFFCAVPRRCRSIPKESERSRPPGRIT